MPKDLTMSHIELEQYIKATGESSNIDAKGPIAWDSDQESASLAKDIAAFANSRDGGVLVIGRSETDSGGFESTGLSDDQANSFETTKVATWVNNYFSPSIKLVCHHHRYQGKRFVIITIEEFDDVPILCTKSFLHPPNSKKHILRERTLYIRNSNAESAPLGSVEELRTLIGLATAKRADEITKLFAAMTKGRSLVPPPTDEFKDELGRIEQKLGQCYEDALKEGAWRLVVHPAAYEAERWPDRAELTDIVRKASVQLRVPFPDYSQAAMRNWGLCKVSGETWTLARSGQFLCVRPYKENSLSFTTEIASGQWIEFKDSVFSVTEMFMFISRFIENYKPDEELLLRLHATALVGRKRVTTDPRRCLTPSEECPEQRFKYEERYTVAALQVDWNEICAKVTKRFLDLFPGAIIEVKTIKALMKDFENRQI